MTLTDFVLSFNYKVVAKDKTFMQIAGYPRWENVWSNILCFFFNNEMHNMNGFLINCFSIMLGKKLGNVEYAEREVYTEKGNRIDIVVSTDEYIVVIENKVDALLNNDLHDYLSYAKKIAEGREIFGIVLSKNHEISSENFTNILYSDLLKVCESQISKYLFNANTKYAVMLIDYLENIKQVVEDRMDLDNEYYSLYLSNKDNIEQIINGYNNLEQYCKLTANTICEKYRTLTIHNLEKIWVYERKTAVLDLKEKNKDLKLSFDVNVFVSGIKFSVFNRKFKQNDSDVLLKYLAERANSFHFVKDRYYLVKEYKLNETDELIDFLLPFLNLVAAKYDE